MHSSNPPPALPPFDVSVQSSDQAARKALSAILAALAPLELDVEEISTVELVMAEALNNIVEHAYPAGLRPGPIDVHGVQKSDGLHITIRDSGNAMPDGQLPIGHLSSADVATSDLPEGGFGWFLIKDLARDVRYRRVGAQNRLDLRLAIAKGRVN